MEPLVQGTIDVVVIEDDTAIREIIIDVLQDEGITVELCPLGWQAQHFIRKLRPKLVLLDIRMPDVDGVQLFYLLRADPRTCDIPVMFITANSKIVHDELPNYEELGAHLLEKPFDLEDFVADVRALLA